MPFSDKNNYRINKELLSRRVELNFQSLSLSFSLIPLCFGIELITGIKMLLDNNPLNLVKSVYIMEACTMGIRIKPKRFD